MADNPVIAKLGRRLRLAVVGGGPGALIGPVHRAAARLDDRFEIAAGVLSSDPERSRAAAAALGIPRGYGDVEAMLDAEAGRDDGVDAVAVMTPNHAHFAPAAAALARGLDVICDKPLTNRLDEALGLVERVRRARAVFCLTHNYSGYPMVRQARAMVRAGELGAIRQVQVEYAQDRLATLVEAGDIPARLRWRLDPARGGPSHVLGDIGTHAHQLAEYIACQRVERLLADAGAVVPGRDAHDTASVLMRFDGGARGTMWVTKAATGDANALTIRVYGERAGLAWAQEEPNHLRLARPGRAAEVLGRGQEDLHPAAKRATRTPPGHPEGFHEAFANLYADFAEAVAARLTGEPADPLALDFPTAEDGARGVAFVEAAVRSSAEGRWVDCRLPDAS